MNDLIDGAALKDIRTTRKWSLYQLAQKANVSPATISLLERNKRKHVRYETVEKVTKALGISPDRLKRKSGGDNIGD